MLYLFSGSKIEYQKKYDVKVCKQETSLYHVASYLDNLHTYIPLTVYRAPHSQLRRSYFDWQGILQLPVQCGGI